MALNDVVYNKTVDVAQSMPVPVVFAKQNENGKRKVIVTLLKNGQPFLVGTDISGYIQGATAPNPATKQPVRFKRDLTLIDAEGNASTATFAIAESMTAEIGITQCEIALYDSTKPNEILCTANINIEVQGTGMSPQDEMASDDYQAIVSIKAEVTAMRDEVRTKAAEAIAAQAAAETAAQNAYNSALGVQKIVAGNEAYTKQETDLKCSVAPRKAQTSTTGELKLTDADYGLSYLELQGNSEQYTNTANKNLIDLHFATDGYSISSTGTLDKNEQYFATGYIVVEPGEQYTFTRAVSIANRQGCFYDEDKVFLQPWTGDAGLSKNTVTVPENAKYLRLFDYISHKQKSQLEKGNVATDYVIGAVETPSPDYPSEVRSVGDIPKDVNGVEIRNLLDEDLVKQYVPTTYNYEKVSGIEFEPGTYKIKIEKIGNSKIIDLLFVKDDISSGVYANLLYKGTVRTEQTLTIPEGSFGYFVVRADSTNTLPLKDFYSGLRTMITSASEIDEYRPYIGENNGLIKLESTGKNLFPGKGVVIGNIGAGGIPGSITKVLRTDFIKIDNNKQYVFNPGTYVPYVYLYGSNKEYIKGLSGIPKFNSENADYVILQFNSKPEEEQTQNDVDKMNKTLQLEEGTQSTEYQPYHQQITWIPLREPLRGLMGANLKLYADKVDKNGYVTQNIYLKQGKGMATFDTDALGINVSDSPYKYAYWKIQEITELVYWGTMNVLCNMLKRGNYNVNQMAIANTAAIVFNLPNTLTGLADAETDKAAITAAIKAWVNTNNPMVYYALKNPIEYQIPMVYIETYDQETNVRCLNKVKPSSMGLDYKIAISSLIKRLEALETTAVQEVTRNV